MKSLVRWWSAIGCVLVLLLASHCGDDVRTEPATQITARIYVDASLRGSVASLRVVSASQARGSSTFTETQARTFAVGELRTSLDAAPVDVHFVPQAGTQRDKLIEIVVEARNAAGQVLAQERALVKFVPTEQRLLELWLAPCGGTAVCEKDPNCRGASCQACVSGQCGSVPTYASSELLPVDPNVVPDPNKTRPARGGNDTGAITCASPGTDIVCDDGNRCNGIETCDPGRGGAKANGCALVTPEVSCQAGNTCDGDTGTCRSCTERPDGDNDGVASRSCGGNDCDDGDEDIRPAHPELCDGKDNDCNEVVDDAASANADCQGKNGATSTCVMGACTVPRRSVTVRFRAELGTAPFACSQSVELGTPRTAVQPRDFRFFVQDLALINMAGDPVPVQLEVRAPWQSAQVALVDFGGDGCDAATNVEITGSVPAGEYNGIAFVNGVPALATGAPTDAEGVRLGAGFRYVIAAVRTATAAPSPDAGTPDAGTPDAAAPGDAGASSGSLTQVSLTARNRVTFAAFNPATDTVVANFARIFEGVDVRDDDDCEAAAMCVDSYAALGVPGPAQTVFRVAN